MNLDTKTNQYVDFIEEWSQQAEAKPTPGKRRETKARKLKSKHANFGSYDASAEEVLALLEQHEIRFKSKYKDGDQLFELNTCPEDANHNRGEAFIKVATSGDVTAGCHHESCTWGFPSLYKKLKGHWPQGKVEDVQQLDEEEARLKAHHYFIVDNRHRLGFSRWKQTPEGPVEVSLSSFIARLEEEQARDDGENEAVRHFVVRGENRQGLFSSVSVPTADYSALNWVPTHWGNAALIHAGSGIRDHLRTAIQVRSGDQIPVQQVFTHLGWRKVKQQWTYLSAVGALDMDSVQVDTTEGGALLGQYQLPPHSTPEEVDQALRATLATHQVAPDHVILPLWVATFLASITTQLPRAPEFSIYLFGASGSRKTTLELLMLNHFGSFPDASKLNSFHDTANAIEKVAFVGKDALVCVDDFHPTLHRSQQVEMQKTFTRIVRNFANRTGRNRMNADSSLRVVPYPRGMLLASGEDLQGVGSDLARLLLVEVAKEDVQLDPLTEVQRQQHLLPHALADFLRFWRDHREKLLQKFDDPEHEQELYRELGSTMHTKLPRQIFIMQAMTSVLSEWLVDRSILTELEASQLCRRAEEIFVTNAERLQTRIETLTPTHQFLEILQALKTADKLWIKPWDRAVVQETGDFLGWRHEEYIFAQTRTVWHLVQRYCQQEDTSFPVGERTLWEHLAKDGVLELQNGKTTQPWDIPVEGNRSTRVMKLRESKLFEAQLE